MPLKLIHGDITKIAADAIVNAANIRLAGGGGVDGAIHRAAGPKLDAYCRKLNGCPTGEAVLSPGFNLPAKWIIHTAGPIWMGGGFHEEELLRSCYTKSLQIAADKGLKSVAFPLISAGIYGYPRDEALAVAAETIGRFLQTHDLDVSLVIFHGEEIRLPGRLKKELDHYLAKMNRESRQQAVSAGVSEAETFEEIETCRNLMDAAPAVSQAYASTQQIRQEVMAEDLAMEMPAVQMPASESLDEAVSQAGQSFAEALLQWIDKKGLSDSACYRKANIDRRLFSKIRSAAYHPSKKTVVALALALELTLDQMQSLLEKAGYVLSSSLVSDQIVRFFVERHVYDIFEINNALFAYHQPTL